MQHAHVKRKKEREEEKRYFYAIKELSKIVKFISEYKTLIKEEHTIAMTTKSLKAWKVTDLNKILIHR